MNQQSISRTAHPTLKIDKGATYQKSFVKCYLTIEKVCVKNHQIIKKRLINILDNFIFIKTYTVNKTLRKCKITMDLET